METDVFDLAVIGGGINGCGIARDAAGRGLSVFLTEQDDLANGTSSSSTKLIHGGLRYLEHYEFRLVRESLREREILLKAAPHIIWPLRFILPHHNGLRPAWLIRLGLFIYDHLGGRKLLPGTSSVNLKTDSAGNALQKQYTKGFEYSDCWVLDSRLVVLNAMDAAARGATIRTRSQLLSASRESGAWTLTLWDKRKNEQYTIKAKVLVNATGPWLDQLLQKISTAPTGDHIRLVKGSHIIVNRLYEDTRSFIFQNNDDRIIFAIPYEQKFTLIGTTDVDFTGDPGNVTISEKEIDYLCSAASEYFTIPVTRDNVVSSFSGIRPLFDDGKNEPKAATRDYILKVEGNDKKPTILSIYGGKITTYRKLAESVLHKLSPFLPPMKPPWTAKAHLPGGDFPPEDFAIQVSDLREKYPLISEEHGERLIRNYGTRASLMLAEKAGNAPGINFGHSLFGFEVDYLVNQEWALTAEDILWRRTRLGLLFSEQETRALQQYLDDNYHKPLSQDRQKEK